MTELINDWEPGKGVVVRYASKCRRCGGTQKSDTPDVPEGWKEDVGPNADGLTPSYCPTCSK